MVKEVCQNVTYADFTMFPRKLTYERYILIDHFDYKIIALPRCVCCGIRRTKPSSNVITALCLATKLPGGKGRAKKIVIPGCLEPVLAKIEAHIVCALEKEVDDYGWVCLNI